MFPFLVKQKTGWVFRAGTGPWKSCGGTVEDLANRLQWQPAQAVVLHGYL
jgi:hypothetical protein